MKQKLVRDNIPAIITADGKKPITRIASAEEYTSLLQEKLVEEVTEFIESEEVEELADILEVIESICIQEGISFDDVRKIQKEKATSRGSFSEKIILEDIK